MIRLLLVCSFLTATYASAGEVALTIHPNRVLNRIDEKVYGHFLYEFTVEARKTGGNEGFLVLVRALNNREFYWANLGGWGNIGHALERGIRNQDRWGSVTRRHMSSMHDLCRFQGKKWWSNWPPHSRVRGPLPVSGRDRQALVQLKDTSITDCRYYSRNVNLC